MTSESYKKADILVRKIMGLESDIKSVRSGIKKRYFKGLELRTSEDGWSSFGLDESIGLSEDEVNQVVEFITSKLEPKLDKLQEELAKL